LAGQFAEFAGALDAAREKNKQNQPSEEKKTIEFREREPVDFLIHLNNGLPLLTFSAVDDREEVPWNLLYVVDGKNKGFMQDRNRLFQWQFISAVETHDDDDHRNVMHMGFDMLKTKPMVQKWRITRSVRYMKPLRILSEGRLGGQTTAVAYVSLVMVANVFHRYGLDHIASSKRDVLETMYEVCASTINLPQDFVSLRHDTIDFIVDFAASVMRRQNATADCDVPYFHQAPMLGEHTSPGATSDGMCTNVKHLVQCGTGSVLSAVAFTLRLIFLVCLLVCMSLALPFRAQILTMLRRFTELSANAFCASYLRLILSCLENLGHSYGAGFDVFCSRLRQTPMCLWRVGCQVVRTLCGVNLSLLKLGIRLVGALGIGLLSAVRR